MYFMASAADAFGGYTKNQQRELSFAIIAVSLGAELRSAVPALISNIKVFVRRKIELSRSKKDISEADQKYLNLLLEIEKISPGFDGLKRLEDLKNHTDVSSATELFRECFSMLPSVLRDPCFGVFTQVPNSLSNFAKFMTGWHYSGDGYSGPPKGFSEPFSGFDKIVNALMGHPRCRAEAGKQAKAWEKWQAAHAKKAA
jgi:hypothetical protein